MQIKMLTTMAGPHGSAVAGSKISLPAKEARALIKGGYAEAVEPAAQQQPAKKAQAKPETATAADAPETAGAGPQARKPGVLDRLLGKGDGA